MTLIRMLKKADNLKEEELLFVEQLCRLSPDIKAAKELSLSFQKMIKERESAKLDQWIERAEQSGLREMKGFAEGLKRDKEAVFGALKSVWSNGQVEGQINRLKTIKRQMYGRANFDLLKARVLYRSS